MATVSLLAEGPAGRLLGCFLLCLGSFHRWTCYWSHPFTKLSLTIKTYMSLTREATPPPVLDSICIDSCSFLSSLSDSSTIQTVALQVSIYFLIDCLADKKGILAPCWTNYFSLVLATRSRLLLFLSHWVFFCSRLHLLKNDERRPEGFSLSWFAFVTT